MGKYRVWCPEYGQDESDAKTVEATGPQYAAQKWAEWRDAWSAEYTIVGGTPATASVWCEDTLELTTWIVYGEAVPEYTARLRVSALLNTNLKCAIEQMAIAIHSAPNDAPSVTMHPKIWLMWEKILQEAGIDPDINAGI